jgi:hypothetical protein
MSAFDHMSLGRRGPYGTNIGDIWSGEHSEVGKMLMERENLVMIHEIMVKDGKAGEHIYSVKADNPDMEMQSLIRQAREGTKKWVEAQAHNN